MTGWLSALCLFPAIVCVPGWSLCSQRPAGGSTPRALCPLGTCGAVTVSLYSAPCPLAYVTLLLAPGEPGCSNPGEGGAGLQACTPNHCTACTPNHCATWTVGLEGHILVPALLLLTRCLILKKRHLPTWDPCFVLCRTETTDSSSS